MEYKDHEFTEHSPCHCCRVVLLYIIIVVVIIIGVSVILIINFGSGENNLKHWMDNGPHNTKAWPHEKKNSAAVKLQTNC